VKIFLIIVLAIGLMAILTILIYRSRKIEEIDVETRFDVLTGVWIAHDRKLDIYSQGTSEVEARRVIESARIMYLEVCSDRGIDPYEWAIRNKALKQKFNEARRG